VKESRRTLSRNQTQRAAQHGRVEARQIEIFQVLQRTEKIPGRMTEIAFSSPPRTGRFSKTSTATTRFIESLFETQSKRCFFIGEYFADLLVEDQLIIEVKAAKAIADEHLAQILGYLRSARMEHGVLVNFGAAKFQIRKLAMSEALHQAAEE
jgi:hypothetical protein